MEREKKLTEPVTLFAAVEKSQHETLRKVTFEERRSIADVVRDAIDFYIKNRKRKKKAKNRRNPMASPVTWRHGARGRVRLIIRKSSVKFN